MFSPAASVISTPSNTASRLARKLVTPSSTRRSNFDGFMTPTINYSELGGSIRKLPLCGEKDSTKAGFSTFEWHSKLAKSAQVASVHQLSTLQYWVGGSVCALRMIMSDGSRSPKFGKFHPLDKQLSLASNDVVKYIEMRGDSEFVQAFKLLDKDMQPLVEVEGTFQEGETVTYELEAGEKIIGCYGIYNYQPYVVGFGFITWCQT